MISLQIAIIDNNSSLSNSITNELNNINQKTKIISDLKLLDPCDDIDVILYCISDSSSNVVSEINFVKSICSAALVLVKSLETKNIDKNLASSCDGIFEWNNNVDFLISNLHLSIKNSAVSKELKFVQSKYTDLYDNARDMYFTLSPEGIMKSVSQFGASFLGYKKDELIGQSVSSLIFRDDVSKVEDQIQEIISKNIKESEIDFRKTKKDGSIIWVHENIQLTHTINNELELRVICRDITEQKDITTKLRDNEERLLLALESANEGSWDKNIEENKLITSPSFKRLLGYDDDEEISSEFYWSDIICDDDRSYVKEKLDNHFKENTDLYEIDYRVKKKDGSIIWITETGKVVERNSNGLAKRVIGIIIDISRIKEHESGLEKAIELAENANKAKSEFLASMSHEIRTPMNTVIGMLSLVNETILTEEQKEYIEIVQTASEHLLTIINDILDLSKIEADSVQFSFKDLNIRSVVGDVINSFKGNAEQKKIFISSKIDDNVPVNLIGDSAHLKQIMYNLMGNAIKFTHEGECSIEVEVASDPSFGVVKDEEIRLLFKVKDSGIGIANDKIDTVFDSFSQAHSSTKRQYEGTGLGLTISQKLCEKMGGSIWVESEENIGSTFHFTILFNTVAIQQQEEVSEIITKKKPVIAPENSLNILIAEDNSLNQKLITRLLKSRGHVSTIGENGIEAIKALRKDSFDLIFMDIQMPDMDGVEATINIRKDTSGDFDPNIPIVAVTAYAFDEDRQRCFDVGMNDFIPKPINNDKLNAVLEDIINMKKKKNSST